MQSNSITKATAISIIVLGFVGAFFFSNFIESARPALPENYADEDLLVQGKNLKGYSLGFEGLIADWYWIRSLQYIGDKIAKSEQKAVNIGDLRFLNPKLLYPLLDNATSLDPRFMAGYSYGAIVLPAIDNEQAIKIVEKGIRNNPQEWQFYKYLGYIYWQSKDYKKAAETYKKGSEIEGAPDWMKTMAAKMTDRGGERETARTIYQQLFDQAEDSQTKENARLRLFQLDSLDERDAINGVLKTVKQQTGSCPVKLSEIFPKLMNVKRPNGKDFRIDQAGNLVDPSNAPYLLDSKACEAILDPENSTIPKG